MNLTSQRVRVNTGSLDQEGCLVFADMSLVAVLVRLSDQQDGLGGRWFLEAGFGRLDGPVHPTFADLTLAEGWIRARLS